jgi:DNA (cytosine-5)-methyltransferase 1
VAWHPIGWKAAWYSEIEPFPCAVLKHHYPAVPNYGDMTKYEEWPNEPINLLVGGTPCQSFSVAGLRKGLADPRGNLMLTYGAIARRYRPEWLVWENVPGVLSSNGGRDFGTFLGMLAELGYGFAYRVLDAQYFGVAQRRRRVFVVANARSWQRAAAVLFESHSLQGHPAPSREARQGTAPSVSGGLEGSSISVVTGAITARFGGNAMGAPEVDAGMYLPVWSSSDQANAERAVNMAGTLNCNQGQRGGIITAMQSVGFYSNLGSQGGGVGIDASPTLKRDSSSVAGVATAMQVRRLTPVECERLQGFPDGYTNIPWRKKPESPDGPRYKALGNSMAVPVMAWIGKRIQQVSEL